MAEQRTIEAQARAQGGKGAARAVRRAGQVPGIIYGDRQEPVMISIDGHELYLLLRNPAFSTYVFDLVVGNRHINVIARDVQYDPVTDYPLHIDFLRVSRATRLTIEVPVNFVNEEQSPGIKKGGVLNVVRHGIEVTAVAGSIPESIEVDLTGRDVGDSIHISDVKLPEDVVPTISDRDFTVATIAAPSAVRAEAAEAAEEAEGEAEAAEEESEPDTA